MKYPLFFILTICMLSYSAQAETAPISLELTARAGLDKLTQREASTYYLRMEQEVRKGHQAIQQYQTAKKGYASHVKQLRKKESIYGLSQENRRVLNKLQTNIADITETIQQLEAQIHSWTRRQAFLLETYPIGGQVRTQTDKFRLAPETKSSQFLNLKIHD